MTKLYEFSLRYLTPCSPFHHLSLLIWCIMTAFCLVFLPLLDMATNLIILKHNSDHLMPLFATALHQRTATQPLQCYLSPYQHGLYADTMFSKYRITFALWFFIWKHLFYLHCLTNSHTALQAKCKDLLHETFLDFPGSNPLLIKFPIVLWRYLGHLPFLVCYHHFITYIFVYMIQIIRFSRTGAMFYSSSEPRMLPSK